MSKIIIASIALISTAALIADEIPPYAKTASVVAESIESGDDLSKLDEMFELPEIDRTELAKLSGCDGFVRNGGSRKIVMIDWICGEAAIEPGLRRTIAMIFDEYGVLYGLAINGTIRDFQPTEIAQEFSKPLSSYRTARLFSEAVIAGKDPSLDGYIPLSEYDLSRLMNFKDGAARVGRRSVSGTRSVRFTPTTVSKNETSSIILYFDEKDLPIGVVFQPIYDPIWKGNEGRDLQSWTREVRSRSKR